jgi:hypothetical protein
MSVFTEDGEDKSLARIGLETGDAFAIFIISTKIVNPEGDGKASLVRNLRVKRNFADGTGEIEPAAEMQKVYLDALKGVIALWDKNFTEIDQLLQCRTCASKVDRLPGTVA